ncbi:MAG: HD domain-containing protein [Clostridiales bacterium]|nr:HD domain-containing protein [Clostridiales bacterium]
MNHTSDSEGAPHDEGLQHEGLHHEGLHHEPLHTEPLHYDRLSAPLQERIRSDRRIGWENPWRCEDDSALRRDPSRDAATLWRPAFVRDVEKVLHSPYYNRYTDKTQVLSFYRNDDITRRALHVQLVSRIARTIGRALGLNQDLIEAIALGHDLGHTPFGHAGEEYLSELIRSETGQGFYHNVHSVRVLDALFCRNLTLQSLDGVLCHNGELVFDQYQPEDDKTVTFLDFDRKMASCAENGSQGGKLTPNTLEGCVVRISDMVAYLGKDRQDARRARILQDTASFSSDRIGQENAEIINNVTVNLVENSYGKPFLKLDREIADELQTAKQENYERIYKNEKVDTVYKEHIQPMFRAVYYRLLDDLAAERSDSLVYRHHIDFINENRRYYLDTDNPANDYAREEPNRIAADYIASMTDDYFVDLYHHLFPDGKYAIRYVSYFAEND